MTQNLFNPKVSIIIPVYNGSNYLREAIDSALAQTYKNIEVIVINDGSNDNGETESIALSYRDKIRYFSKPNGGVATALNLGIEKMTGEYFSWLSHDDVYYPNKIEIQINKLSKLTNKKVVLFSDFDVIDEKGIQISQQVFDHEWLEAKPLYALLRSCIHGCALLIPKKLFEIYGLFDINLKTTQDYALWFKMIRQVKFVHIPQILIRSRLHPEQGTPYKRPESLQEANELWIYMMESLTDEEILACEKNKFLFYFELSGFLKNCSPYDKAYSHSLMLAKRASKLNYFYHSVNKFFYLKLLLKRLINKGSA